MIIRSRAPLRLGFFGGGTDVEPYASEKGGIILNATINKYVHCSLIPRKDKKIFFHSIDFDTTFEHDIDGFEYNGKLDIPKAVMKVMKIKKRGFDLYLHADAPPGSGLGTSSTVVVATIGVFKEWLGIPMTDYEVADLAIKIERGELKYPGGKQDQYAATFGGFNFIEFFKNRTIVTSLRLPKEYIYELEYSLLQCFTKKTRESGKVIQNQMQKLAKQKDTQKAFDLTKKLTYKAKEFLMQGKLAEFGKALDEGWKLKKQFSDKISNPKINKLYATARSAGAVGGKISGAGGGGFMMIYCDPKFRYKVAQALIQEGALITQFTFEKDGMQTWRINS